MTCPVCGEPLRPDYGEDVEPVISRPQVYAAHTGRCADELRAALAELELEQVPTNRTRG